MENVNKSSAAINVKVLLIGDSGVGKTSLSRKYTEPSYTVVPFEAVHTIPGETSPSYVTEIVLCKKRVRLIIGDTVGEERFRSITSSAYRGIDVVILAFDVIGKESYSNLTNWIGEVERYAPDNVHRIVVATKLDLVDLANSARVVPTEDVENFVKTNACEFFETSALDNHNVAAPFEAAARYVLNKIPKTTNPSTDFPQRPTKIRARSETLQIESKRGELYKTDIRKRGSSASAGSRNKNKKCSVM